MLEILLLLLPVAATSGWFAGYKHRRRSGSMEQDNPFISPDYFLGLNYLINEQTDKAVDVFIKMLEVNSDTVETHLALGNLFRKRGEVDRAIRIHQNIIARPQLVRQQRIQALSELAQDYLRAGVLDRAEKLFLELLEVNSDKVATLIDLQNIYQQQKDWKQAITIANRLEKIDNKIPTPTAYYYCELAEQSLTEQNIAAAQTFLRQAFAADYNCPRISMIEGKLEASQGNYKHAIKAYKKIRDQVPDFISETVVPLAECYRKLNCEDEFVAYLRDCLAEFPRISLVLALADYVRRDEGDMSAINFIAEQVSHNPTLRGISRVIEIYLSNVNDDTREKLKLLQELIAKLLEKKPIYRCVCCGFAGRQLYWLCPSCKNWGVVRAIHGPEGD